MTGEISGKFAIEAQGEAIIDESIAWLNSKRQKTQSEKYLSVMKALGKVTYKAFEKGTGGTNDEIRERKYRKQLEEAELRKRLKEIEESD